MKAAAAVISILSLAVCLILPVLWFLGSTDEDTYKAAFLAASIVYFVFATLWARHKEEGATG